MAAVQKITLSPSLDVPFNKLVLSQANVRRVKAGVSIEELAEDIARRTLLQGLSVRPILDAEGAETGMYEVPAGGRRYRALELLIKQKRLLKTAPIPCVVRDRGIPEEDSLAENVQRAPLHPLDQFRAFFALRQKGLSEEEIAAAFFVSAVVVRQRLRLVSVSEVLLDVYAADGMSLDQLMAFTISSDHARQEQVWEAVQRSYNREPYQIRRMLTENTVRAADKRVQFVGTEAYETAGGIVLRDLFQSDDGGWIEDVALLDRLVAEKLKALADQIASEGWKWVVADLGFPYGHTQGLRKLVGTAADLTPEERATVEALEAEHDRIEDEYAEAEELPDETDRRLGEIETALDTFAGRPLRFDPAEIGLAGAFVSIGADGSPVIDRGYVRPEDEPPAAVEPDGEPAGAVPLSPPVAVVTVGCQPTAPEEEEDGAIKPLPDRLVMELTAYRTLALRDAVAEHPQVALTLLLHKLVGDTFRHGGAGACLEAFVRSVSFPAQPANLADSPPAKAVAERHAAWEAELPEGDDALWNWLAALDDASRLALLAHCVSFGVNALYEKVDRFGGAGLSQHGLDRRLTQAGRLAGAVDLDLVEAGWHPTADNYLGRVTKSRILEAVREGVGDRAAQLIDHLKKGDMAKEAERLLTDSGWLPELLRPAGDDAPAPDAGSDAVTLPDFLAGDDGTAEPPAAPEAAHSIAAE
ncbi:ParB/RepB/Spo0J family partition protein [Azospirillum agricola]|uniref:ParB/RepB/Spo0J family partition protein n=1 Tax=Azospirillum agricola TaxID=1720247 RepID=UPI000A0F2931|nr:ParB/RepB/Spo0J family partition protein [Azospirillum agricola]SMH43441.1 chromosome partitioning protein, ParB family [Azospirillum lipoferum]